MDKERHAEDAGKLSRREFIKRATLGAATAGLLMRSGLHRAVLAQEGPKSRLVHVLGPGVLSLDTLETDAAKAQVMLAEGMKAFTGAQTTEDAWKQFVGPDDVVGLKINCLGKETMYNDNTLLDTIASAVETAGVPAEQIIIFDRYTDHLKQCGFTLGQRNDGVWIKATDGPDGPGYDDEVVQEWTPEGLPAESARCSKIVTQEITKLINLPILKTHGGAGVTLALKNLGFGLFKHSKNAHNDRCSPYIPSMCANPVVQERWVLNILDGLKAQYEGGPGGKPQFQWAHNGIMISTDPVAMDYLGWLLLNEARQAAGIDKVSQDHARHVLRAERMGLGVTGDLVEEVSLTV